MAENSANIFEEKQYLGLNKYSIYRRSILMVFLLVIYYFSEHREQLEVSDQNEGLLLLLAGAIVVFSIGLLFVLHLHTVVREDCIVLNGFWTARKVKISFSRIQHIETIRYSRYFFNRPVYNLHSKGKIKFYTRGSEAVKLTDEDGLVYIIGTQRAGELAEVIRNQLTR